MSLEQYLCAYVNHEQNNWSSFLPLAEFCQNNSVSSTTKITPFFAVYGTHPRIDVTSRTKDSPTEELMADRLQRIRETLQAEMTVRKNAN